jgi:hypothetical protein
MITHNKSHTRLYKTHRGMLERCCNINSPKYSNYGERGIIVCDEWLGEYGFVNFYNWAINNGYTDELTIDRINVNGNYCPENCRWATWEEQAVNRSNTRYFKAISPDKNNYYSNNIHQFCLQHDLTEQCVTQIFKNRQYQHKGWIFELITKEDYLLNNMCNDHPKRE